MSRTSLPWYRAYWTLVMDEDYSQLSIAQQGVYHNLRDWAAGQTPRGTFQVRNLESLARAVACGDVDLLRSVIDILTTTWRNADGTPHVVITDERGAFTTWEKWQRPPSQEPAAVAERKGRYKEHNNADRTVLKRPKNDAVERDRDRDTENRSREISEIGGGGNTNRAREGSAGSAAAIFDRLGITENGTSGTAAAVQQIREALNRIPEQDRLLLAGECRNRYEDWDTYPPGKKAGLVTKWVREEAKGPPSERGARASPNGAASPLAIRGPSKEAQESHAALVAAQEQKVKRRHGNSG